MRLSVTFLLFVFVLVAPPIFAAELTAQQKADLQFFGLSADVVGGDALLARLDGGCSSNPYKELESRFRNGSGVQLTPHIVNGTTVSDGIDPVFACRLTKFLEVAEQNGCRPKLISGYRSAQLQASMCGAGRSGCAAAGRSCHQYGLAVDVSASCVGWMRMAAPQFQLVFPYYGDHIQCAEHPVAACSPSTRPCNGSIKITPDLSRLPAPSQVPDSYFVAPPGGSPDVRDPSELPQRPSMFNSPVGYFNPTPSPTPTQTQTTPTAQTQTQPQICDPKLSCSSGVTYYQTSSCTTQVYQVCQYGCSTTGVACATSTSTAATSTRNLTGTSTDIGRSIDITNSNGGTDGTTTPSVSELLERFTGPVSFTPTEIGTSTSLVFRLNPETGDIESLDASERPKGAVAPGTITSVQPPPGQQTFTSDDLGNTYNGQYGTPQNSTFQSVLDGLKSALMWALNVLRGLTGTGTTA